MFKYIDPFLWQLVMLLCNAGIELAMGFLYDLYSFYRTSWNIFFPLVSFLIAYPLIGKRRLTDSKLIIYTRSSSCEFFIVLVLINNFRWTRRKDACNIIYA